jgi:hypothetical protein
MFAPHALARFDRAGVTSVRADTARCNPSAPRTLWLGASFLAGAVFARGSMSLIRRANAMPRLKGASDENGGLWSELYQRRYRDHVLRAAGRLIADIFSGLCRWLDPHSFHAWGCGHRRSRGVFTGRSLDAAALALAEHYAKVSMRVGLQMV